MARIGLVLLLLFWFGTAHATPCTQPIQIEYNAPIPDGSPLPAPANVRLAIAADHADYSEWLAVDGDFDPRTKYIGIEVDGYTMLTTPDDRYRCSDRIRLYDQTYDARIFAVDAEGKRSEAVTKQVSVIGGRRYEHVRCGMYIVAYFFAAIFGGGVFLVIFTMGFVFRPSPAKVAGERVSPVLAENVSRQMSRRATLRFALALATTIGLWVFDHPFLAIAIGPTSLHWLIDSISARLLLRQFSTIHFLERRENWVLINSSKLYAPRRVWAKASTLPTAGLK